MGQATKYDLWFIASVLLVVEPLISKFPHKMYIINIQLPTFFTILLWCYYNLASQSNKAR